MANPSPGNSITLRVEAPSSFTATSELAAAVGAAGAAITALDVTESHHDTLVVDVTCNTTDDEHAARVKDALNALDGVKVQHVSDRTFLMHLGGKLEVVPKVALRNRDDLSRAYTPGVARVCLAIAEDPSAARNLTIKRNTIAVVTDGSAVLGLGNIGPAAALPVMEGKAALFKQFANVDAWPVCLDTQDTEEIIRIVKALAPVYGGVNLEDIAAPRCFEIENRLRAELDIPVFHDDQHGTAIVTLAALVNALRVVGKKLADVKIVVSGVGAAGSAIIQLLKAQGASHIIAAGRSGAIHHGAEYDDEHRSWIAANTNEAGFSGTLHEALKGADVFIGVSAPNVIGEEQVASMAKDAIVFAMANPTPEIDPVIASKHAAVVATGRSDYPNQINNVLAFPGFFRGLLDAGASDIIPEMLVAAAKAIANRVADEELNASYIIPSVFDPHVAADVAAAVAAAARENSAHAAPPPFRPTPDPQPYSSPGRTRNGSHRHRSPAHRPGRGNPDPGGSRLRRGTSPSLCRNPRRTSQGPRRQARARGPDRPPGFPAGDPGDPRRRLERGSGTGSPAGPPGRDDRAGRPGQDGHQRAELRCKGVARRPRGRQHAHLVQRGRIDPQPPRRRRGNTEVHLARGQGVRAAHRRPARRRGGPAPRLAHGRTAPADRRGTHRSAPWWTSACTSSTPPSGSWRTATARTTTCPRWRATSRHGCGTRSSSSRRTISASRRAPSAPPS